MPISLLCWILALSFVQILSASNNNFPAASELELFRAQMRNLWINFVMHNEFIPKPFAQLVKLRSVIFYKIHDGIGRSIQPRPGICIDRQPPKGTFPDTCKKQRDSGHCEARLSGINKDGFCARTCDLCTIANFGMRTTFEFRTTQIQTQGRRKGLRIHNIVTLDMQPTGDVRVYNTYNNTFGAGVRCQANRVLPGSTIGHRLRM